jgi:hypothetical protein
MIDEIQVLVCRLCSRVVIEESIGARTMATRTTTDNHCDNHRCTPQTITVTIITLVAHTK